MKKNSSYQVLTWRAKINQDDDETGTNLEMMRIEVGND